MSIEVDSLEIKIQASSTQAAKNLDDLAAALARVKGAAKGGIGLTTVANQLSKLNNALAKINVNSVQIVKLIGSLNALSTVQKSTGLNSTINTLRKLPEVTKQLESTNLGQFAAQMRQVADAVRPLATEMQKVSQGFAAFPIRIQRLIASNAGLAASNNATAKTFSLFGTGITGALAKLSIFGFAVSQVASVIGGWITESNAYIENLNLFTVAMGEYAEEAQAYAEQVSALMGIDPSEWMRNQGVFQTLLTGFGVVASDAALMSKNLTQLGYDISSFFNISYADSMQKLQSGISGELEPLRRLGYDLSEARLEAIALANGIDISVSSMTQAQKAQLRYYAILTQVTTAQGDMARTLQAPANQLRILQASVTQAARALGNIFIPALNAVLPYAIAFVNVIRWVAQEIANLFGFSLPEVDYSSVSGLASAGSDAEESLGDAAGAAKELKGALLGIDELNIIEPNQGSGGSGGGGVGVGDDLGLELPEYDFLGDAIENRANEIFASLKNALSGFVDFLKSVIPTIVSLIDTFKPAIMGVLTALGLIKAMNWIKRLLQGSKQLGIILTALTAIRTALKNGLGPLKAIKEGWKAFSNQMKSLSPFTKATIAVAGLGAEFVVVHNAIKDLILGNMTLGQALLNIVPTMTVVGVALTAMWGKWGLLATAVMGVVAAITGFNAAQREIREDLVEAALFDGQGESIQNLGDRYVELFDQVGSANDKIITMGESIDQNKEQVQDLTNEIGAMITGISNGVLSAEDTLPQLTEAFQEFNDTNTAVLEETRSMILYALSTSIGQAAQEAGLSLSSLADITNESIDRQIESYGNLADEVMTLWDSFNSGEITESEFNTRLANMGQSANIAQEDIDTFSNALANIGEIDLEDTDTLTQTLGEVSAAATTAMENTKAAYDETLNAIRTVLNDPALTGEQRIEWSAFLQSTEEDKAATLEQIKSMAQGFVDSIWTEVLNAVPNAADNLQGEWDSKSFWDKLMNGLNSDKWIASGMEDYKTSQIQPIAQAIQDSFGTLLGEDSTGWGEDAFDSMMDNLFAKGRVHTSHVTGFTGDVQEVLEETLPKYVEPAGETVPDDLKAGIESNTQPITDAATTISGVFSSGITDTLPGAMQTAGIDTIAGLTGGIDSKYDTVVTSIGNIANDAVVGTYTDALGVHSPSTVMTTAGENTIQGLIDGITNKQNAVSSAMGTMLNALLSKMETFTNRCRTVLNNLLSDFASAMKNVSVSSTGAVAYTLLGARTIPRFAEGGYPVTGQLFLAREAGPEMVGSIGSRTAVANNGQIVEGISYGVEAANEGVINAILSATQQLITAIQDNNGEMYMDGEKVGEIVTKWQNRQARVYNKNLQTV